MISIIWHFPSTYILHSFQLKTEISQHNTVFLYYFISYNFNGLFACSYTIFISFRAFFLIFLILKKWQTCNFFKKIIYILCVNVEVLFFLNWCTWRFKCVFGKNKHNNFLWQKNRDIILMLKLYNQVQYILTWRLILCWICRIMFDFSLRLLILICWKCVAWMISVEMNF